MDNIQARTWETGTSEKESEIVERIMRLHRCEDCPIRCAAVKKPRSIFGRIHRWHRTWWPGYKIYQREQQARAARATGRA